MTPGRFSSKGSFPGLALNPAAWEAVQRLTAELLRQAPCLYPWENLPAATHLTGGALRLAGYGSLLNASSAALTLRPAPAGRRPVIVFGFQRVFNYRLPDTSLRRLGSSEDPRARAALNVYPVADAGSILNGVCQEVVPADIPALCLREQGYDLHPACCLPWDRPDDPPFVAWILSAPDESRGGARHTDDSLLPHPAYYQLCRDGAASCSDAFLQLYLDTTYLADRQTTARMWEQTRGRMA